jgi:uncharacterized protein YceK
MKKQTSAVYTAAVLACCSGCGSLGTHGFDPNSNLVYGGVRQDAHQIGDGGGWFIIDVPFSFAADTLFLPFDLYHLTEMPPSVDPLKDWKSWSQWDEESHPAIFGGPAKRLVNPAYPATHSPLDQAIKDDYENFIKGKNFRYGPEYGGSIDFFEDGTGKHAVKIVRAIDDGRDSVTYILIYDKSDVRIKVIKYKWFKAPSLGG